MARMKATLLWVSGLLLAGCARDVDTPGGEWSPPAATARAMAKQTLAAGSAAIQYMELHPTEGRIDPVRRECVNALQPIQFEEVAQESLLSLVGKADLRRADEFFATQAGEDYMLRNRYEMYRDKGIEPPEPAPVISAAEDRQIKDFLESPAGENLNRKSRELIGKIRAQIHQLMESCAAAGKSKSG